MIFTESNFAQYFLFVKFRQLHQTGNPISTKYVSLFWTQETESYKYTGTDNKRVQESEENFSNDMLTAYKNLSELVSSAIQWSNEAKPKNASMEEITLESSDSLHSDPDSLNSTGFAMKLGVCLLLWIFLPPSTLPTLIKPAQFNDSLI